MYGMKGGGMGKRFITVIGVMAIFCLLAASLSWAEGEQSIGARFKSFWQGLFKYPARVTEESVDVVSDTARKTTSVVTTEVKRVGEVTSGDLAKTKELIVEPITGTAETIKDTAVDTVKIPIEATKE